MIPPVQHDPSVHPTELRGLPQAAGPATDGRAEGDEPSASTVSGSVVRAPAGDESLGLGDFRGGDASDSALSQAEYLMFVADADLYTKTAKSIDTGLNIRTAGDHGGEGTAPVSEGAVLRSAFHDGNPSLDYLATTGVSTSADSIVVNGDASDLGAESRPRSSQRATQNLEESNAAFGRTPWLNTLAGTLASGRVENS